MGCESVKNPKKRKQCEEANKQLKSHVAKERAESSFKTVKRKIMGLGSAIGNGIPFQDKRNEDIPEICFIITELDDFCEQETVIGDSRMFPELCVTP